MYSKKNKQNIKQSDLQLKKKRKKERKDAVWEKKH